MQDGTEFGRAMEAALENQWQAEERVDDALWFELGERAWMHLMVGDPLDERVEQLLDEDLALVNARLESEREQELDEALRQRSCRHLHTKVASWVAHSGMDVDIEWCEDCGTEV